MSDGVGESGRDAETNSTLTRIKNEKRKSRVDDFSDSVARVSVAQICESAGFQGFQQFALDNLSDVAVRYICELGKAANTYANLACRTECNVFDVIQGLEDLGSSQGFSAASDVHHCLLSSGTVRKLVGYVGHAEEIPFAYSLPGFPVSIERKRSPSFLQMGEFSPAEHIPSWLPAFPEAQAYTSFLPVKDEKGTKLGEDGTGQLDGHQEKDFSLLKWKQLKACNGSQLAISVDLGNSSQGKGSDVINPFQLPPVPFQEKKVSPVSLPARLSEEASLHDPSHTLFDNHVAALDASAPVTEAVNRGQSNSEDGKDKIPLNRTHTLQFTLGSVRNFTPMTASFRIEDSEILASWFSFDDQRDDCKEDFERVGRNQQELIS